MSKNNRTVSRLPMATSFYGYEPVQGMVPPSFGSVCFILVMAQRLI